MSSGQLTVFSMQDGNDYYLRAIVKITSSKWTLPVLHTLLNGTKRYHQINVALPDITQKVLTDMLRKLERYGFVKRTAYPTVPPKVEYSLTDLGESFATAFLPAVAWARSNLDELDKTEELYDLR